MKIKHAQKAEITTVLDTHNKKDTLV